MCEPTTIVMAVAAVATAFQQVQQGKFEQGVAKYNTRLAENEAENTRNAATEAENDQREQTAQLISRQRAQLGAAGVDLESGSALQLQTDAAALGEADALRIRSNFDQRVGALESQATLTKAEGDFVRSNSKTKAFGTLLSASADIMNTGVADKWMTSKSAAAQGGGGNAVPRAQQATALGF